MELPESSLVAHRGLESLRVAEDHSVAEQVWIQEEPDFQWQCQAVPKEVADDQESPFPPEVPWEDLFQNGEDNDVAAYDWDSEDIEPALVTAAARLSAWVYSPDSAPLGRERVGPWEVCYDVRRKVCANTSGADVQKATVAVTFDRASPSRRVLAVAVVFRGTARLQDWLQSVACVENRARFYAYGLGVHSGMWTYVENDFFEHGQTFWSDLDSEYQKGASLLLFVGHSLGGGMACISQLLGLLALEHPELLPCHESTARNLGPGICWLLRSARAITFAAPMAFVPMQEGLHIEAHLRKKCLNFVHNNDPVPRLPGAQEFVAEAFNGCGRVQISLVGVPAFMASWTLDVGEMVNEFAHEVPARNRYRHFSTLVLMQANGMAVTSATVAGCERMLRQKGQPTSSGGFMNWWSNDAYDAGMDHLIARHISGLPWFTRYRRLQLQVEKARELLWLSDRDLRDSDLAHLSGDLVRNHSIKKLDLAKNKIGDAGVEALVKMFEKSDDGLRHPDGGKLQCMIFSWNNIGDAGAAALASYLKHSEHLQELRLDGNWIGELGAVALAEVLFENSVLRWLHIAGDMFSTNRIGDAGAAALAGALQHNCSLRWLLLTRCSIGPLGAEALAHALKVNRALTLLHVSDNHIGNYGANALAVSFATSRIIQDLNLENTGLDCSSMEQIASSLKLCNLLHRIELSGNDVGDKGLRLLSEAWGCEADNVPGRVVNLKELCLNCSSIGTAGAHALAMILQKSCCQLQLLSLANNQLGNEGAIALATGLERNSSLQDLTLCSNMIGDEGVCAIATALQRRSRCNTIDLIGNQLSNIAAEALAKSLAAQRDKALKRLLLTGNNIGDPGGKALADVLKRAVSLKEVHLMGNPMSESTLKRINTIMSWEDEGHLMMAAAI